MTVRRILSIFLVLGVIISLFGCTPNQNEPGETTMTFADILEKSKTENLELDCGYPKIGFYEWGYTLNVRIENGTVFLNNVPYTATYDENFQIYATSDFGVGGRVDEVTQNDFEVIRGVKGCYILETDSEENYGERIAVYIVDDLCYFVRLLDDNGVMLVHSVKVDLTKN